MPAGLQNITTYHHNNRIHTLCTPVVTRAFILQTLIADLFALTVQSSVQNEAS